MIEITTNQIINVLDEALEDYKNNKVKFKNVIIMGEAGSGKTLKINEWLNKHNKEIKPCFISEPVKHVEKDKETDYYPDLFFKSLKKENTVGIIKYFNYFALNQLDELYSIFKDRTYLNKVENKTINVDKLGLLIAEATMENSGYNVNDISKFKECSEVYVVKPSVEEFKEFFNSYVKEDLDGKDKIDRFNKILSSPSFNFIFTNDEKFGPDQFINLFTLCTEDSDEEILKVLSGGYGFMIGGVKEKTLEMFKKILGN